MCGIIDDLLPVIGAVGGFFLGGPVGAAIGGGLGGAGGNYAQTHSLLGAVEGGVTGGLGGYFGGGSLANALEGLGSGGVGATSAAFDTGLGANVAPSTLGGLETSSGGAGLYGINAGTGTAIGGTTTAGALGGNGLGVAGGDTLSGITSNPSYLGALGGSLQGTGLGLGGAASGSADLSGALGSTSAGSLGEATSQANTGVTAAQAPYSVNSPVANMSATTAGQGISGQPTSALGSNIAEGSQAATTGSGAPYGFDATGGGQAMEGMQATPGAGQGSLAALYGPQSTAVGSPAGQGIAATQAEVPGQGVQFGALGEGTSTAPGMATGATTGATGVGDNGMDMGNYGALMRLFNTGVSGYQQMAKQHAYNNYVNDINNEFAPNSPYAQQMQQTLARQDAAAGRNSQYGTRAVQLAAALTQARAQALGNSNYANARTATPGSNVLNGLFYNFANPQGMQSAQQLYGLGSAGFNSLQNLFS